MLDFDEAISACKKAIKMLEGMQSSTASTASFV